jgi:hypothetical protein
VSFWYTPAKEGLAKGDIDFDEAGNDIRALLVMSNSTADTDQDAGTISAFGTLDEYDGAGYTRQALAAQSVVRDDANNRAELMATSPIEFGATVAAGTRQAIGCVIYKHVGADSANIPLIYIDSGGFPIAGGGGPFRVAINAEGFGQIT